MALLSMPLDERVLVCGQLSAREISVVEPMGVSCVVNNRPDSELGFFQTKSAKLERAARQSGVAYLHLPFSGDDLSAEQVAAFRQAMKTTEGTLLVFCRTGFRSALIWAAAAAADGRPVDELLEAARKAGFDLSAQRERIEALAVAARGVDTQT